MNRLSNLADGILEHDASIDEFVELNSISALLRISDYAEGAGESVTLSQATRIRDAMIAWIKLVDAGDATDNSHYYTIEEPLEEEELED